LWYLHKQVFVVVATVVVVVMVKVQKEHIAVNGTPISQLRDITCHMGSHSVTCHPTQVNAPRFNASH